MRTELLAIALAASVSIAHGQAEMLRFGAPATLFVNEANTLQLELDLPRDAADPLLLTVHAEGPALDVVRGRMARDSARPDTDGKLRFVVPVVGRAAGSAIVRAKLRFFRCVEACRAQEAVAACVVEVRAR